MTVVRLDLAGIKVGKLTPIRDVGSDKGKNRVWLCQCDCGNQTKVTATELSKNGTRSCGCSHKEKIEERYGRLAVIREVEERKWGRRQYLCRCDCGKEKIVKGANLNNGHTRSCGCLSREVSSRLMKTHGQKKTRLYRIWAGMKTRCLNQEVAVYPRYGGKGVTLCDEWMSFEGFQKWANASGYKKDLTIERMDNDGNYEPGNCTWISMGRQSWNRSNTIWIAYNGETKSLPEWCNSLGLSYQMVFSRLKYLKWSVEKAFETPNLKAD